MRVTGVKRNPNITIVTTTITTTTTTVSNGEKATIHNVFIVDASGSMDSQGKYGIAISGLNELLKSIREDQDTNNNVMIVEFEGSNIVTRLPLTSDIPESYHGMGTNGMTPLNQAVGETLESVFALRKKKYNSNDKVLVNIFTDGGENASRGKYQGHKGAALLGEYIKSLEEQGFTVTFVGTTSEVNYAINTLSLSASNTLSHQNTASTVRAAFDTTKVAREMYSKSVSRGEDVKTSFYSKTVEKTKTQN